MSVVWQEIHRSQSNRHLCATVSGQNLDRFFARERSIIAPPCSREELSEQAGGSWVRVSKGTTSRIRIRLLEKSQDPLQDGIGRFRCICADRETRASLVDDFACVKCDLSIESLWAGSLCFKVYSSMVFRVETLDSFAVACTIYVSLLT